MIGEVLAGLSALSSLFGSLKSAQANTAIDRQLERHQMDLDTWYNKEYNINYLDTEEARSILEILRRQKERTMKKVDQSSAIRGASDEARVATASEANRDIADEIARLAGYGTQYKQGVRREYQGLKSQLSDLEAMNLQNKSQQWSNFINNAMNAGIGFAQAGGAGAFQGWEDWWKKYKKRQSVGGTINPVPTSNIKIPSFSNQ